MTEPVHAMGQFGSGYNKEQTCSQVVNKGILYKVFCLIYIKEIRSCIVLSFSRKQLRVIYIFLSFNRKQLNVFGNRPLSGNEIVEIVE